MIHEHTGPKNWNQRWRDFFDANQEFGKDDILDFLEVLKEEFGL